MNAGDEHLVELVAEVVHGMNEVNRIEVELVQHLTATVGNLAAAVAELERESVSLRARVATLERGDVARDRDVIGDTVVDDRAGLHEQARQAQRHAEVLLKRTTSLAERASELLHESHEVLASRPAARGRRVPDA